MEAGSFEDLACGRVLYHRSGYPNFPVRLAGEVFLNCLEIIGKTEEPVVLYDPCCGGAYMMTVLGFLFGNRIGSIYASDISESAVALAGDNLRLLTPGGLECRKAQLKELYDAHGRESHLEAIASAERLSERVKQQAREVKCTVFSADAMDALSLKHAPFQADVVFTDVPYGNLVSWSENTPFAIDRLLDTVVPVLKERSVVAVASDKSQKISNPQFKRVRKLLIGKRKVEFYIWNAGKTGSA